MTTDGVLITGAGKAYDSGLGADYSGRGSSLLGRERLMTADGGLFVCVSVFFFL